MMHPKTELCFDFIRHGQSVAQIRPDLIGGRTPAAGLTPLGEKQADALGERLRREGVVYDFVYSSTFPRARATAVRVCKKISFDLDKVNLTSALIELDQGRWEGRVREEVMTPEQTAYINSLAPWFCPPGGESQQDAQRRMAHWLESEILKNNVYLQSGRQLRFGIFAHGTAMKCLFQAILEFRSSFIGRGMYIQNCSLSRFRFNRDGWAIDSLNDIGHLVGLKSIENQY